MEFLLGRAVSGENARKIDNPYVSATHCRVWCDDKSNIYYIEDMGSTNGTYVNGVLVRQMAIKGDDKILLGGEGGYATTLEELLSTSTPRQMEHSIEHLRKIYDDYHRDMTSFKTKAQVYSSIRIIPSALISIVAVMFAVNDNLIIAVLSFVAVIACLLLSTVLMRKNEEKMKERITKFQLTYVCPRTRRFYGDKSWQVLQNEAKCMFCNSNFQ